MTITIIVYNYTTIYNCTNNVYKIFIIMYHTKLTKNNKL